MGLLEDALAVSGRKKTCTVGLFLNRLDPDDRAEVEEVLALPNDTVNSAAVHKAMIARWDAVPESGTIQRHRSGRCKCGRDA